VRGGEVLLGEETSGLPVVHVAQQRFGQQQHTFWATDRQTNEQTNKQMNEETNRKTLPPHKAQAFSAGA